MKRFACEMCGNNDLIKIDGVFECQYCRTKYTIEEAKKLMVEVDGVVEVRGKVSIDNSAMIQKYLEMSEISQKSGNFKEAIEYANKTLDIENKNFYAWYLKGVNTMRIIDGSELNSVKQGVEYALLSIDYAPKEKIETLKRDIGNEMMQIFTFHINSFGKEYSSKHSGDDCFKKIKNLMSIIVSSLNIIVKKGCKIEQEKLKNNASEIFARSAITYWYEQVYKGFEYNHQGCEYYNEKKMKTFKEENAKCVTLLQQSLNLTKSNILRKRYLEYLINLNSELLRARFFVNESNSLNEYKSAVTSDERGTKVNKIMEYHIEWNKIDPSHQVPKRLKKIGGCYVATCVYGSYDCPQVWTLRRYRDNTLGATWYGRAFVKLYYAISPTLVKWFGHTKWFKKMWKGKLDRMVKKLNDKGVEDTPYYDNYL